MGPKVLQALIVDGFNNTAFKRPIGTAPVKTQTPISLDILKKLYSNYTKKYLGKIFLSVFFSTLVAGSTALIAYLLDPAIEKIFLNKEYSH